MAAYTAFSLILIAQPLVQETPSVTTATMPEVSTVASGPTSR